MARSLVLGNGSILVCLDKFGQVRDFYYDYVGLENHMASGLVDRIGVWLEENFSWLESPDWEISVDYKKETLASEITAFNPKLEVKLTLTDIVYNEKNILIRQVEIKNLAKRGRTIKVFFNHQLHMYGVNIGDTAYFDPNDGTIVHYKGRRIAVIGGQAQEHSFDDYTCGLFNVEGKQGTWKDAEDGVLSKNPTENGSVDTTISFSLTLDSEKSDLVTCWVAFGKTLKEVKDLHKYVLEKTTQHLLESTQDFWHAWVNKLNFSFYGLGESVIELFKRSLLIMRTHCDNMGGIIASGDSGLLDFALDTYGYVWTRDASFTIIVLDKAGYFEVGRKFFNFCNEIISDEGFFFLKYRPDKSLGGSTHAWIRDGIPQLPIQEDETAMVIYSLWRHYELTHDLEFIESVYNSLIKKAGDFMVEYRDPQTRLPKASFDLWEMKWGISTFTASTIYGGLKATANFARLLGKERDEERYSKGADEIKTGILKHLYSPENNFFYKHIEIRDGEIIHDETVDMSSFYGVYHFGILEVGDERLEKMLKVIEDKLICKTEVGGVARFEGDNYFKKGEGVPGNPWFITTLWLAQYYILKAKNEKDLEIVKDYLDWTVKYALPSGILSEQINVFTGEQLSVSPLIWSHAAFVSTVIKYLEKLESWGICKVCIPVK